MRLLFLLFFIHFCFSCLGQEISVYDLICEHKQNPIGLHCKKPRLSWKIKATEQNTIQIAYSIRVSQSLIFQDKIIWESGKVNSEKSNLISYNGPELESTVRYYWQVKIWDNHKNESEWSEIAFWEMGLLEPNIWKADWIEPNQDTVPKGPAIYLRKDILLQKSKKIKRARAYATAKGLYSIYINGKRVGNEFFTPGWTTYQKRLQYQVYDISHLFKPGQNTVGAILGDGWYKGHVGYNNEWGNYGKKLAFLCQLIIEYEDGTREYFGTDKSWKSSLDGPIVMNSIYHGETYDARKEFLEWDQYGFNDKNWTHVHTVKYGFDNLVPTESMPVKKIEEIKPLKIWKTPGGSFIVDMGQNMVGITRINVTGPKGTVVTLKYAEVLDKNGELYRENLRRAEATNTYILKGKGHETYEPEFTFFGFRYVSIDGYPGDLNPENLTGIVIHSDMAPTGTFTCSNPLINQLQKNIQWGQKGNFLDVPTDCPQRDERLGWTGDAQAFASTAAFNMNVAAFFTKWLKDMALEQNKEGAVPFVVPNILNEVRASAGWSDAITIIPWTLYQVYGDKQILGDFYPAMVKYINHVHRQSGDDFIWKDGCFFGDWLFYKPGQKHWPVPDGHTNHDLIATAFSAYSTQIVIDAAKVLDKPNDVKKYTVILEKIKEAFNSHFVTPSGRIVSDSQTSYVLAIMFNLLSENQKEKALTYLIDNINIRKKHLSTGFLGTPYICHVLSNNGQTSVGYDLLLQETYPSWLYPVKMGATTIWERWDGIKPDSSFQNKSMNSFNHYAYGAIGDWLYKVVAGINLAGPGYKDISIQPQPDPRLKFAEASLNCAYGMIKSGWRIKNDNFIINVEIPPNTNAILTLPGANISKVKVNGEALSIMFAKAKQLNEKVVVETGSGKYYFEYPADLILQKQ